MAKVTTLAAAAATTTLVVAHFKLERDTKNAFRYMEVDEAGHEIEAWKAQIGTFYLKKSATNGKAHPLLSITVSVAE